MDRLSVDQNEQICRLIIEAGQQALQLGKAAFDIYEKGQKDFVTSVDRALDRKLSSGLATLFPTDGIVTEENVRSRQAFQVKHRRLWLIDPIDGTDNFIRRGGSYKVKPWDTTGPLALALAAGLTCCGLEGQPLRWDVDAVDGQTLIHQQTILIGWSQYIEQLRPKVQAAVQETNRT
ncbi:hypothetical protein IQ241_05940 [Romeria aff. gracilis LEGE 07310]|uniref:Inositol monophosphatase n=1 Tax=Vasconcelosia minhoensis LEGE 07310 TaxID=915328 RepID=A0A8J7ALV6_9CYAN|nr:hypothetical protein [Romeria aff. gracilis LEGE 07310]